MAGDLPARDPATPVEESGPLPAGRFSVWLGEIGRAIAGDGESDVPCGSCTACCEASQFIHVAPDETDAISHIPSALLFPAPGLPSGHRLMGYDEHGRCPMLLDGRCSIYAHRPRTCRTYDCRVFAAADVVDPDPTKAGVAQRASRWRFDEPLEDDVVRHGAVRAAAQFLQEHAGALPPGAAPVTATQRAVLAVELHEAFVAQDVTVDVVVAALERLRRSRP
jgi:hypothetical protein